MADGVQGVLVTANSFAESWRSRACHEGISLLSNAAQELLHMAAGAPCPDNSSRPDGGVAEDKRGEGGCSTNRLEEQRGARGRAPSKYRRIAEQAEDAFRECRSSDVVVDARGDVRRRRSDAFFTDQGPRRPGSEPPACGELRLSPMKVDLRLLPTELPYAVALHPHCLVIRCRAVLPSDMILLATFQGGGLYQGRGLRATAFGVVGRGCWHAGVRGWCPRSGYE